MKALVLSGGSGTRLRPLSFSMPKQLVPVAGRPVLEHCLSNIREAGVTEVGMIVGDRGGEIEAAIGDGGHLGLAVTYIPQHAPLGLAHCVTIAADFLGDDDFVMYLGDNVLAGGISEDAARFRRERPDAQLLTTKVTDPSQYGVVELDPDGRVVGLEEKSPQPRSDLAIIGVYFFTAAIHEAVRGIRPSARGELEITDAVQWLVTHGRSVRAGVYDGYWKDTGNVADLLDCNRALLAEIEPACDGEVDAESCITGRVRIEAGARVVRSTVTGPAIVGAGTVVEGSDVGPFTTLGPGCRLTGAGIEDSIVLDGVRISGVTDIAASVLGRSCRIEQATETHQLVVSDHSRVDIFA